MGMTIDELADTLEHPLMRVDGYDDCVVGYCASKECLVYDATKMIAKLMADGASEEEAAEHFEFNIECAYVGEHTPLYVWRFGAAEDSQ
jgi:hypothetical protein